MRRILIQDCRTKLFYRADAEWVSKPEEAGDFSTSLNAMAFCLQNHLTEVQIVVKLGVGVADVVVPVRPDASA